jgi:hypothetical protein
MKMKLTDHEINNAYLTSIKAALKSEPDFWYVYTPGIGMQQVDKAGRDAYIQARMANRVQ